MRIAIVGAGAIGCFCGGKLAASGADVRFLARGAMLEALRDRGLRIESATGDVVLPRVVADEAAALGPVDAVLFAVKRYDTAAAAAAARPLLGAATPVVTLQNGIGAAEAIEAVVGPGHAVGGTAYMAVAAGLAASVAPDIARVLWRKFVLLSGTSAMTALTRRPIGVVRGDPALRRVLHAAIAETAAVAIARGIGLTDGIVSETLAAIDAMAPDMKASQLVDLERGRRLELDYLSGAIVAMGEAAGVPTPVHATVYAALRPFRDGGEP